MKIAFADCFSGISGDMFLAALLDAGLSLEVLEDGLTQLNLTEKIELRQTQTHKGALRATDLEVVVPDSHKHRHLSDVLDILARSKLSDQSIEKATKIFTILAEAEARVHGQPVEQVHFHEVGALDSIVDIIGAVLGLEALGIERLFASPLPYGSGVIDSAHGPLPLPAPATLEVLRAIQAPLVPSTAEVELVTPTGAAILGALAAFDRPEMMITELGVGAGKRDLPWPNLMRLIIGETNTTEPSKMVQLETNIDDMNPQFYGHIMEQLFSAGARDVFLTPIQMKKNRPGTLLGVIALQQNEAALAELILRETTTLGLRVQPVVRYEAQREFREIQTSYGTLTVKIKILNGEIIQAVPEYDECVRLAAENNVSLTEIYQSVYQTQIGE